MNQQVGDPPGLMRPLATHGRFFCVNLGTQNEVGDHIAHLPAVAGAGCTPGLRRQGVHVLLEPFRLRKDEPDTFFWCVHVFVSLSLSV